MLYPDAMRPEAQDVDRVGPDRRIRWFRRTNTRAGPWGRPAMGCSPVDFLRQLMSGIAQAWRRLSLSARINIVLASVTVTGLFVVLVLASARTEYLTLSANAEPDHVTKIVDVLSQQGIPYRLENNNRTILVPTQQRSRAQLLLAENNLPVGRRISPGLELFQERELMTNQWLQDVKFMRAIQGEIERQLNAFEFINYSYVLIREAKEALFVSEQRPSEAAVTLEVTRPLTKQEVKAIVSMVAHAGGPNLHTGNITITTTKGEVLYLPPQSDFASIANSKLELVADWERQRENKVLGKLRDLGVRGTVTVSAKLNFDHKEINDERVTEGTELSTFTSNVNISSTERLPEGAPGAFANVPEAAAAAGGAVTSEATEEEIVNYEPSRTMTKTRTDPGDVVQFLVALIVEGDYEETVDEQGNVVREYTGLSEDRRQAYIDLAKAAVGEGEVPTEVTLHDHPFAIEQLPAVAAIGETQAAEQWAQRMQWIWTALQILGILVGFFALRMLLRRAIEAPGEHEEEEVTQIPEATREDIRRNEVAMEVNRLASEEPEAVAALLRGWMTEEHD